MLKNVLTRKEQGRSKIISVVLPLYNEEEALLIFLPELVNYLSKNLNPYRFDITFIDDCSTDDSCAYIQSFIDATPENVRLSLVQLAKNSGSHVAISAGINISKGDFVIILASDGQDPPEVISALIREWEKGQDIVLAARAGNLDQGLFARIFSKMAWKLIRWSTKIEIPAAGCDLLGIDKAVVQAYNKMDERNTSFLFKLLSLGFKKSEITYVKRRRFAGKSKWTFVKKISILLNVMLSFSNRPLRLIKNVGLVFFVEVVFRWAYIAYKVYCVGIEQSEFNLIIDIICTAFAFLLLILGLSSDYVWRILNEARKKSEYEIKKVIGKTFDEYL